MNPEANTLEFIKLGYALKNRSEFLAVPLESEVLLYDRGSGNTLLLDVISFGILATFDDSRISSTDGTPLSYEDIAQYAAEAIEEHLTHLEELQLIEARTP